MVLMIEVLICQEWLIEMSVLRARGMEVLLIALLIAWGIATVMVTLLRTLLMVARSLLMVAMTVVLMVARIVLMVAMAVLMDARMIALFVLMSEVPGRR